MICAYWPSFLKPNLWRFKHRGQVQICPYVYVISETLFPLQIDKLDSAVETITSLTSPAQILFPNDTFWFMNVCAVIVQRTTGDCMKSVLSSQFLE